MSGTGLSFFKTILETIKFDWKLVCTVLICGCVLFFLPQTSYMKTNMAPFLPYAYALTFIFFVYGIMMLLDLFLKKNQKKKTEQQKMMILHNLIDEEKEILAKFIDNKSRTSRFYDSGELKHLEKIGVIYRIKIDGLLGSFDEVNYNINDNFFKYLILHPELLVRVKSSQKKKKK